MRVMVLGPVTVAADDAVPVDVPGVRLRMLLARLALEAGRPVQAESLVDDLWGEQAPAGAAAALQGLVSRLRKVLHGIGGVELVAGGYRLPVHAADVDAHRFEELAADGRRALAAGRDQEAAAVLSAALELWRGPAFADVLEAPFATTAATRLQELRAGAVEDRFEAELHLGRHAAVLADLGAAAAERPLSERLAGLRLRALSAAGRQSDALAVYEEMRARLGEELGVDPSPELREVYLALLRGELDRPATQPAELPPSRLPASVTTFVGREEELGALARLMSTARMVTIVGSGGAGKTRLALEVAARDPAYPRGRLWFVPLAGLSEPDRLADAVLGVVGASDGRLYDGGQPRQAPADRVADLLDVGEALLLLDNCEHLVEAAAGLADNLLHRLPQLRILATSREPLGITGEALWHLGPLALPTGEPDLAEASGAAAVRLFVDRAAGVRPGFALEASTVEPVVEICRRLDGMPLALELAAAKLRSMQVEQVARRLDDRFRLLTSGSRAALPRQRTLLAMVEWSWDLLDEAGRTLARRLSVFPGGADLAALEAVCSDSSLPARDVLYVVDALVEKSIVQQAGDRYRMLETVRAYLADRLAEAGEDVGPRFAAYYLSLAERHEPRLRGREQLDAIAVFDAEQDNLVAALQITLAAGDAPRAYRFLRALFWYWANRGLNTQLETYMGELLELGDAVPAPARRAFDLLHSASGAREVHPARLLWISQRAFSPDGPDDDAQFERALTAADPWLRATANWAHNFTLVEAGDLAAGARAREVALRGFEEVGDRWGLVMSLLALGRGPSLAGDFVTSIAAFERAVAISAELGTEEYLYWTRNRLARERMRAGDLDGARRDLRSLQERAEHLGHRRRAASLLFSLANWQRRAGELAASEATLDTLEGQVHRLPYPEPMARDLIAGTRMMNRLAAGSAAEARALLPRAVRPNFTRAQSNGLAWAAEQVGELLTLESRPAEAATALGMSEAIRGAFDHGEPALRALVAALVKRLGADAYRAAYAQGAGSPRPDALTWLARLTGQA